MLILKCKCFLLPYGGTKRHNGNGRNKKCFLYILRVFFLILQPIIQQKQMRLIIISLWVPLSLAFGFALSWFSMPLKERNCSLGISIHGFKVTLQENAGLSHNPLMTYKNKKTTSSQNAEEHKYLTYMRYEFAGPLFILLSQFFLDLFLSS